MFILKYIFLSPLLIFPGGLNNQPYFMLCTWYLQEGFVKIAA